MYRTHKNLLLLLLVYLCCTDLQADKTDVVFLKNGDRITGEAKSLIRGKLEFSTDHMGTIYIEWKDILEIVSHTGQAVELTNGQRFYGPLTKPEAEDMLVVNTAEGSVGVSTLDVIAMYPVEAGFWERLDVSASLGFSWDKGSNVGKYSLGLDAVYRDPRFITRADFKTEITTQENSDDTTRSVFNALHIKFTRNKMFRQYFGNLEHNDQLGLDLRALVGIGIGWIPIRSQKSLFMLSAGLDVNREIPTEGDAETNLEATGTIDYEYFRYSTPERSFKSSLAVFPSLTDFGRWRAELSTDFRLEFIKDLFWVLDVYASYDSRPISAEGASSDYGITSSLGYKF